ncbi:zinc-dependent alcohol dehydrogenase family protein [Nitrospirillum sp. BR 11828]|uniref:zinc-dependent alcohol dehydrogenase family protein n=1 Tax=Nitrospirillum sp. BR 11828 TaxID=3104325 RepID=UPI002ACA657A|nr:zinc-dependent alcohol dehydrogenase family protein [Nitrospirillum sp. BR 11828]MDZ5648578.1 zinc-dependent alcohol dehydrogenase family protein [Nitrospirillum sp. BR 11828]
MRAMVLGTSGALQEKQLPDPEPGPDQVRIAIHACGVCRTDLHVIDGDLPPGGLPRIPGHEVVGVVDRLGAGVSGLTVGQRVGVGWLAHSCRHCPYCLSGHENLCDAPGFTGYTRDGGFATLMVAEARYVYPLDGIDLDDATAAPLLCAGLIGWRSLVMAGPHRKLGIYGFGAAGHIILQVARWQGAEVYVFTRPDDLAAQEFALSLGAVWAGGSDGPAPEPLDAAILYAPVGALVPAALAAVRKGGRVVCAGIHMSDIPAFPYDLLWGERQVVSVANLTRDDALDFLRIVPLAGIRPQVTTYPLAQANQAIADLRAGRLNGAAVLVP